jgi:hypothetical protein
MGAVLVPMLLILVAAALGWLAVRRFTQREVSRSERLQDADRPTLRYEVPAGQDPAAVLIGLREAGYEASPDSEPGPSSPLVIIGTPTGEAPDREQLRVVLARITGTNVVPSESETVQRHRVVFADES